MSGKITTSAKTEKKESGFKKILHQIFVHNIGYKLLAIGTAAACWFLTVWLS